MQFKHPEILYALALLLIPILVHLFQLRRFKKVPFSNVQFLKEVTLQTRKSSQIKKWLTLLTRLLLLAAIILAFAQPYFSKTNTFNAENETVIYLDNSFSMQAKGAKGNLLNRAIQDILESVPEDENITLFTNTETYKNTTLKNIKNELLQTPYASKQLDFNSVLLKGKKEFKKQGNTIKNLILVSDFQQRNTALNAKNDSIYNLHLITMKPVNTNNISIDSVYISKVEASNLELTAVLKNQGKPIDNVSVSLYNKEELIAKTAVGISETANALFSIARDTQIDGKLVIDDNSLAFDNELFFNINPTKKINVLAINQVDDNHLQRIFTSDEFNYSASAFNAVNFNTLADQNLIILNELESIPVALSNAVTSFKNNGGTVLIIPSRNANVNSYNQTLANLNSVGFSSKVASEKKLTNINYSHPLYQGVFDKKVSNFQYPKVTSFYALNAKPSGIALQLEDGNALLFGNNNVFIFSASISKDNSNFINSPLIVPTLYNIGKQSLNIPKLYYTIGNQNKIDVPVVMQQDAILKIENETASIIPQQQTFSNKVAMTVTDELPNSGVFSIKNKEENVANISFNHNRNESNLRYQNLENLKDVNVSESFVNTFSTIKSDAKVNELWKWFVIFALVFLLIELLILKYFK